VQERDARIASDTRTEAQKWLGDPPVSRSALSAWPKEKKERRKADIELAPITVFMGTNPRCLKLEWATFEDSMTHPSQCSLLGVIVRQNVDIPR
jgi:hypothetical protein